MAVFNNSTAIAQLLASWSSFAHLTIKSNFAENELLTKHRVLCAPTSKDDFGEEINIFAVMWSSRMVKSRMLETLKTGFFEHVTPKSKKVT
ncbi:hypothetical protein AnigIFM56816_005325 [Aspergillus niger]|nr:hypothetical protein AnigIFM56816_005325 [Aspergillus niger]